MTLIEDKQLLSNYSFNLRESWFKCWRLPEPSGSWTQSCRSLDPPLSTPETAHLDFHWQPWRPSWRPDHMWVKPCHRQEKEDIPDCLLGATITTGGSIITGDLGMQENKKHRATSSYMETQIVHEIAAQMQWYDWLSAVHFSPSAWLDCNYDRHAGKRTITGKVKWLSRRERETHLARLSLAQRFPCCTLDFGLSCQITFGIPQTPSVDSCRPPDITLITETSFLHQKANSSWVWTTLAVCAKLWVTKEDC